MNRFRDLLSAGDVDPESRSRALLIGGMLVVVVFALALVAVGYYVERVQPRGETVFTVGDREFSYSYLEDRAEAAFQQGVFNTSDVQLGIATLISDIQNEQLVRFIAQEQGLTVTPEELDAAIREDAGVPPGASNDVMAAILRDYLQTLGLSLDRYEEVIEARVLEEEIKAGIREDLPAESEQVDISLILVSTDAAAATARDRIQDGEPFADVAMDVSQHSSSAEGGALGWTPEGLLIPELADAAFSIELDTLSDVIEAETGGFYLIEVDGREVRELDDVNRDNLVLTFFGDRLEEESEQHELTNVVTTRHAQDIASHLSGLRG